MITLQGPSQIISCDEELTLYRDIKITYIDGKPVDSGGRKSFTFQANVQPLLGRELLIVPEADRFKEMYYVWSYFQVLINDLIVRQGINFQVQQIENWGSYTRSRMVRIDVGNNASD
jgi:hypothetical protein